MIKHITIDHARLINVKVPFKRSYQAWAIDAIGTDGKNHPTHYRIPKNRAGALELGTGVFLDYRTGEIYKIQTEDSNANGNGINYETS